MKTENVVLTVPQGCGLPIVPIIAGLAGYGLLKAIEKLISWLR